MWCTARVFHASLGAVTLCHPLAATANCRRAAAPRKPGQQAPALGMSQGCPINASSPGLASEFCLVACYLAYLFPHFRFVPRLTPTHPHPHRHRHKRRKDEASEREACIGLYSILVCSKFRRCRFTFRLVVLSLFFLFGVQPPASGVLDKPNVIVACFNPVSFIPHRLCCEPCLLPSIHGDHDLNVQSLILSFASFLSLPFFPSLILLFPSLFISRSLV